MRVEISDKKDKEEKTLYLALEKSISSDEVKLVAVNKDGSKIMCGNILGISDRGLTLRGSLDIDLGLPIDSTGKIALR